MIVRKNRIGSPQEVRSVKRKYIFIALLSAVIISQALPNSWAGPDSPRDDMGMRGHGDGEFRHHHGEAMCFGDEKFMKEKLSLNEEQIDKIGKINLEFRKLQMEEREKLQPKKIMLRKLLLNETINLREVKKLLKEISDVEVEIRLNRIRHRIEIEKVLTPEQKKKLKQEKRRFRENHD